MKALARPLSHMKILGAFVLLSALSLLLSSCGQRAAMKPDFDQALESHLASITSRDINAYKDGLSLDDTLYTVVQNGHAFTRRSELIALHEEWFKDSNWIWKGEVVRKVVGEDMAMALIKYEYQAKPEDEPFSTWLVYVFQIQDGKWRIVHDQNTAQDYAAFARSAGIEIK